MTIRHALLLVVVVFSSLISFSVLTTGHNWGGDFSAYIMQAKSIVEGEMHSFLTRNTFTVVESSSPMGPTAYPWGFPLLAAPVILAFGTHLIALKAINVLFFSLFLICAFVLFAKRLSFISTILVISLFAFNPVMLAFHDNILSDIPFLFFSTLSILLIGRFFVASSKPSLSVVEHIFLGLAIFCAYFTRTNGILLLPTLLCCQVIQHYYARLGADIDLKKRLAFNSVPYLVFFVLLGFASMIFPGGTSGGSHISHLERMTFQSIADNIHYYFKLPKDFFTSIPFHTIVCLASLPFVGVGSIVSLGKDFHFIIYSYGTLMLYILWPHHQGIRFIFPIMPFYIYFTFRGMKYCFERSQRFSKFGYVLMVTFWCVIIAFFVKDSLTIASANLRKNREMPGPFDQTSMEMFDFVSEHTETDTVIVFFKPRVMRMLTNRDALMIKRCSELQKGTYYVHKKMGIYSQVPLEEVAECDPPTELEEKFDNEQYTVYKIVKGP